MAILLAEDNPTNQMVAVQMLECLGADVTLAEDGAQALEMFEAQRFDAALIDIEMPRISGIDLMCRIRAAGPPLDQIPMAALTAYVMNEHRKAIEHAGADGVIAKPILSIEQFGRDVLAFVNHRRALAGTPMPRASRKESAAIDEDVFATLLNQLDSDDRVELVARLRQDIASARDAIRTAPDDTETVARQSHILISVAGMAGAMDLSSLARTVNTAARTQDAAAMSGEVDRLLTAADGFLAFLSDRAGDLA